MPRPFGKAPFNDAPTTTSDRNPYGQIGDTIVEHANPPAEPLPGFEPLKAMVFAGLYPVEANEYEALRDALGAELAEADERERQWLSVPERKRSAA